MVPGPRHLRRCGSWRCAEAMRQDRGDRLAPIDRASQTDLAFLAMDSIDIGEQIGLIMVFEKAEVISPERLRTVLAGRLHLLPRLRQRLVRVPCGSGLPIWVDDPGFRLERAVGSVRCRPPGDQPALLRLAAELICRPLPRNAPLWRAVVVTGSRAGPAVVFTLHHVLADGIGGLGMLARLADPRAGTVEPPPPAWRPRPRPSRRQLTVDAVRSRVGDLRNVGTFRPRLLAAVAAGGGWHPPAAPACSLQQRTGSRRELVVVSTPRPPLTTAAHRHQATTNDALLVAVAGALTDVLGGRGERVDRIVIGVPASTRAATGPGGSGNWVTPLLVSVPTTGDLDARLREVRRQLVHERALAPGPPPIALLGGLFRLLAAVGGYRFFMNHQRRLHVVVSHLVGPTALLHLDGAVVRSMVPVSVGPSGNLTVSVQALSYAGMLTIATIVDPDHFPETALLAGSLTRALAAVSQERVDDSDSREHRGR